MVKHIVWCEEHSQHHQYEMRQMFLSHGVWGEVRLDEKAAILEGKIVIVRGVCTECVKKKGLMDLQGLMFYT